MFASKEMLLLLLMVAFGLVACDVPKDQQSRTDSKEEVNSSDSQIEVPASKDTFLIRYDHGKGQGAVSATASNLDGTYMLTISRNGDDATVVLPEETFRFLWDGVIDIEDISNHAVSDPDAEFDIHNNHVIGIVYSTGGQQGMRTFSVPSEGRSNQFLEWVSKITQQ